MQGIYTYIPETNNVRKEYNVAAILSLLFMVPTSLAAALTLMYFYISNLRSMCLVTNMEVFCSSLTSWFPGMVLTYFLNDFEMVSTINLCNSKVRFMKFAGNCVIRLFLIVKYYCPGLLMMIRVIWTKILFQLQIYYNTVLLLLLSW
jgi:hypothetical protein